MSEQQKMSEPCPTCGEDCLVMVNEDGSMLHQSVAPALFKANAIRMDEMSLEIERLKAEVSRRRKPDLDDCDCCGYPMDNEDPDEGYDQWFCPRCIGDAEVKRLKAASASAADDLTHAFQLVAKALGKLKEQQ